jgi:S1-C subfamily serine protease
MDSSERKPVILVFTILIFSVAIAYFLYAFGVISYFKHRSFHLSGFVHNLSIDLRNNNRLIPEIIRRTEPSIVGVKGVWQENIILPFSPDKRKKIIRKSEGAGVVVGKQGYIVTSSDITQNAQTIWVSYGNKQEQQAKLLGRDTLTGIAVIQVQADNLFPISFMNSDNLAVGQWVLAMGKPFGLNNTTNMGIISALGRNIEQDLIQTDAAMVWENRGGALVDLDGNLVGMNSAIYAYNGETAGVGFAIPGNVVKKVIEDLIRHGKVNHGWLGIEMQPLKGNMGEALGIKSNEGVIVNRVLSPSPAKNGGILQGDVIVKAGGRAIREPSDLSAKIAYTDPDTYLPFSLIRNERILKIDVKIGRDPENLQ